MDVAKEESIDTRKKRSPLDRFVSQTVNSGNVG